MVNCKVSMIIMKVMRDDDGFLLLNENERKQTEKEQNKKVAYQRWNCLHHTLNYTKSSKRIFRDELLNENMRSNINLYETFMLPSDACEDGKMEVIITFDCFLFL